MRQYTPTTTDIDRNQTTADPLNNDNAPESPSAPKQLFGNDTANATYGAIMAVLSSPQYLALGGFIVIAAMGHLSDWKTWALYVSFLCLLSLYAAGKSFHEKTVEVFTQGVGWRSIKILLVAFLTGALAAIAISICMAPSVHRLHDWFGLTYQKVFPKTIEESDNNPSNPG